MTYAESNGGAGGLLALCFGVFTAVLGGLLATNWHGFAARFLPDARTPDAGQRQIPPWRRAPGPRGEAAVPVLLRVLGGFFAVAGAVITVVGISSSPMATRVRCSRAAGSPRASPRSSTPRSPCSG